MSLDNKDSMPMSEKEDLKDPKDFDGTENIPQTKDGLFIIGSRKKSSEIGKTVSNPSGGVDAAQENESKTVSKTNTDSSAVPDGMKTGEDKTVDKMEKDTYVSSLKQSNCSSKNEDDDCGMLDKKHPDLSDDFYTVIIDPEKMTKAQKKKLKKRFKQLDSLDLKTFPLNEHGQAKFLAKIAEGYMVYVDEELWYFNGIHFARDDHKDTVVSNFSRYYLSKRAEILCEEKIINDIADIKMSGNVISTIIKYLKANLARSGKAINIFDQHPNLLNVLNGTIKLETGELLPHNPKDLLTQHVHIIYDPNAKCPRFEKFLWEIADDDRKMVKYLQRVAGYAITGEVCNQIFIICYGSGSNGKGVFFDTLTGIMPEYSTNLPSHMLLKANPHGEGPSPFTMELVGKRLAVFNEWARNDELSVTFMKQITSSGEMSARGLCKDPVFFKPTSLNVIVTNDLPRITATDNGSWRRVRLLPFDVEFGGDKVDRFLPEKLKKEYPGILAWMVKGSVKVYENEFDLDEPKKCKKAKEEYRKRQDSAGAFLSRCKLTDPSAVVRGQDVQDCYKRYCDAFELSNVPTSTFSQRLQSEGIIKDTSHASGVFYKGIILPDNFDEEDDTETDDVDSDEEIDTPETESNHETPDSSSNDTAQEGNGTEPSKPKTIADSWEKWKK